MAISRVAPAFWIIETGTISRVAPHGWVIESQSTSAVVPQAALAANVVNVVDQPGGVQG